MKDRIARMRPVKIQHNTELRFGMVPCTPAPLADDPEIGEGERVNPWQLACTPLAVSIRLHDSQGIRRSLVSSVLLKFGVIITRALPVTPGNCVLGRRGTKGCLLPLVQRCCKVTIHDDTSQSNMAAVDTEAYSLSNTVS